MLQSSAKIRLQDLIRGPNPNRRLFGKPSAFAKSIHSRSPTVTQPMHDRVILRHRLGSEHRDKDCAIRHNVRTGIGCARDCFQCSWAARGCGGCSSCSDGHTHSLLHQVPQTRCELCRNHTRVDQRSPASNSNFRVCAMVLADYAFSEKMREQLIVNMISNIV